MPRTVLLAVNGLMLVLFAVAAVVQYNDPDALIWMAAYGAAAVCCGLFMADRLPALLAVTLSGICAIGTLVLLAQILGPGTFFDPTGHQMMGMMEEAREMLGLLIVAAWTGFLGWRVRHHPTRTPEMPHVS